MSRCEIEGNNFTRQKTIYLSDKKCYLHTRVPCFSFTYKEKLRGPILIQSQNAPSVFMCRFICPCRAQFTALRYNANARARENAVNRSD